MRLKIRKDYYIKYSDKFLKSEIVPVCCFSKREFYSGKLARKYLGQVLSRAYYPSGRKKWFCALSWFYEFLIPKERLLLDKTKSGLSYIHYKLNNLELINNTSGGSVLDNSSGWVDLQGQIIHHCKYLGLKGLRMLAQEAVTPDGPCLEAETPFGLDIRPDEIVFIAKYANGKTNFSKITKHIVIGSVQKAISLTLS